MDPISDQKAGRIGGAPKGALQASTAPTPPTAPAPSAAPAPPSRATAIAGVVIMALLCAVSLGLAFRSGAYGPADWLPFLIGLAALAIVVSVSGPVVLFGRLQKALLALFGAQAVWTTASILWATSLGNAWQEINRTFLYAVGVALAFAAVRWAGSVGVKALAALVTGAVGVVALVILIRLGVSDDPLRLFVGGRLNYPITYYNGLASLLMIGFWLAMGMANAPGVGHLRRRRGDPPTAGAEPPVARASARADESPPRQFPRWTQPLLLALSVFLIELALLPQSRGALWAFFLVVPFFVILSPHRFRALIDLAIVALPVVLFWGRINGVYAAIQDNTPLDAALGTALRAVGYSVLMVLVAWAITWVVERVIGSLSRRLRFWIGIALIVLAVAGAAGGLIYADVRTGSLGDYLGDRWAEFTGDSVGETGDSGSRFAAVGLNGRLTQWKVAAKAFSENPVLGLGAQNFELYYYQHRTTLLEVRQPHSQPMQLLSELGFPGLLLWIAFVVLALVRAGVLRFRAPGRAEQALIAAVMTAALSWFIHSSADWLWQLAAVTLPAMMLFGGLIGAGATRSSSEPLAVSRMGARASARASRRLNVTRAIFAVLALAVLASATFPYLSLRYFNLAAGAPNPEVATARASTAAALDPTSVLPFSARAAAHRTAAAQAPAGSSDQVEQLKLAAAAWVEATDREPGSWLYFYQAAEVFLTARNAAVAAGAYSAAEELGTSARTYLEEARRLNPLSPQVKALEATF